MGAGWMGGGREDSPKAPDCLCHLETNAQLAPKIHFPNALSSSGRPTPLPPHPLPAQTTGPCMVRTLGCAYVLGPGTTGGPEHHSHHPQEAHSLQRQTRDHWPTNTSVGALRAQSWPGQSRVLWEHRQRALHQMVLIQEGVLREVSPGWSVDTLIHVSLMNQ